MMRRQVRGVTGSLMLALDSLEDRIASIRSKSEDEQRDWEMVTRSEGSGTAGKPPPLSWYWEQARWKEATAMQDKCFG
jgi:hypothetical protein